MNNNININSVITSNYKILFITFSNFIINYLMSLFLIKLLAPSDFGIINLINSTLEFFLFMHSFRFDQLYYSRNGFSKEIERFNYIFLRITSILIGFILFLIFHPIIIKQYNVPDNILNIFIIYFFLRTINATATIFVLEQTQQMKRYKFELFNGICAIIGNLFAILLAYYGFGYKSLIAKAIISNILIFIISYFLFKIKISFSLKLPIIKWYLKKGMYLFLNNYINIISNKIDDLFIGYGISQKILGLYGRSFQIAILPGMLITDNIIANNYPIFIKYKNDKPKINKIMKLLIDSVIIANSLLLMNILIFLPFLIINFFGLQWENIYYYTIGFIFFSLGGGVIKIIYNYMVAIDKIKDLNKIYISYAIINLLLISAGFFTYKTWGIIIAQNLTTFCIIIYMIFYNKLPWSYIKTLIISFLGLNMIFTILINFSSNFSLKVLITNFIIGNLAYLFFITIFNFNNIKELLNVLKNKKLSI